MPQVYLDANGNPMSQAAPAPATAGSTYLDDQGNPTATAAPAPAVPQATMQAPQGTTAGKVLDTAARIPTDPFGVASDALDSVLHEIGNYTQEGEQEHPFLSALGKGLNSVKELLQGGQSAGKPMGTSSGVLNNPVTTAITAAPAAAETGAAFEDALSEMRAAKAAKVAEQTKWLRPGAKPPTTGIAELAKNPETGKGTVNPYTIAKNVVRKVVIDPVTGEPSVGPTSIAKRVLRTQDDVDAMVAQKKADAYMERGYEQGKLDLAHEKRLTDLEEARQKELVDQEKFKQQQADAFQDRGYEQAKLDKAHEDRLKDIETERQKELANTERLRNQEATARETRGKQQEAIDKKNAPKPPEFDANAPGTTTTTGAGGVAPKGGKTPIQEFADRQQAATKAEEEASTPKKIVEPGSKAPPVGVSYESYPRKQLYEMAKKGDRNAVRELLRNPKDFVLPPNSKYLFEDTFKVPYKELHH